LAGRGVGEEGGPGEEDSRSEDEEGIRDEDEECGCGKVSGRAKRATAAKARKAGRPTLAGRGEDEEVGEWAKGATVARDLLTSKNASSISCDRRSLLEGRIVKRKTTCLFCSVSYSLRHLLSSSNTKRSLAGHPRQQTTTLAGDGTGHDARRSPAGPQHQQEPSRSLTGPPCKQEPSRATMPATVAPLPAGAQTGHDASRSRRQQVTTPVVAGTGHDASRGARLGHNASSSPAGPLPAGARPGGDASRQRRQ
jgi:hypothetical protein